MDLAWEPVETVHKLLHTKLQKLKVAMYQSSENVETQQMLADSYVNQVNHRGYMELA